MRRETIKLLGLVGILLVGSCDACGSWRLGVMVGGTWALAYVIFMPMVSVTEYYHFKTHSILNLIPWGYLFPGLIGIFILLKTRRSARAPRFDPSIA